MKFGDSLRQHSVPEWAYYNVDYDAVKHLIKECTSAGKGKAIAIPGCDNEGAANGENRLYAVLVAEHERVGLFVKSKSNEIQGRLTNVERVLRKLRSRNVSSGSDVPRPYLSGRYGKLEREAISAGEEIRALSRFVAAQRTAFRKLLKKYKKWSGSTSLEERFRTEVLGRSNSFTNMSMSETFDRWTDLLQAIRTANGSGALPGLTPLQTSKDRPSSQDTRGRVALRSSASVVRQLEEAINTVSDVNFDTAFSEVTIGDKGARAIYWIHPEQLIELQVLLLQHFRLYLTKQTIESASPFSQSPILSRRSSVSTRQEGVMERENDCGVIYVDNADDYGVRQSRSTVSESEDSLTCAAAAARWTSSLDDATIAFRAQGPSPHPGIARIRRKHLGAFLDANRDFKPWKTVGNAASMDLTTPTSTLQSMSLDEARNVLERNKRLEPLVAILCKRTRFLGLSNSSFAGQWATLDTQICYEKMSKDVLTGKDWTSNLMRNCREFPFAILRIRQEGKVAKDVIDLLDKSHLTERIRGFSLASHAIYEFWKPCAMSPPFWIPALSRDIRKVPEHVSLGRRKSSQITVIEHGQNSSASSNSENDRSGSSTAVGDSSTTSVPNTPMYERDFSRLDAIAEVKSAKKIRVDEPSLDKKSRKKGKDERRYWNEYDYPSDDDDDANAYYIYIDPNKEDKWLGQQTAELLFAKITSIFSRNKKSITDEERALSQPLTEEEEDSESTTSPSDSELEWAGNKKSFLSKIRGRKRNDYGTMNIHHNQVKRANTQLKHLILPAVETESSASTSSRLLITAICLSASVILCVLEGILATTGRKKQKGEVDAGILLGVIASLFFALVGVTSVLTARDGIGIFKWACIAIVFSVVCVADGILVGWILV
ncbi:uncharacterized protein PV09_03698 [Verruconis gallopava]|uniref:SPX domain-containing protein n=1 Tax=Verruconis gallopava TaxID=253628 RepID=A0A0D1YWR2_9PEZI|nr:uncharacterized protein PV09_03698 [Verruconis gallopava]KIW05147.1 hypothetical protein PV09_03698 [Verruconis gallopava]